MARKTTIIRRVEHFVIYRVLHADDTPHRLALGIALGMFVGWTPTVGLQMLLVVLLAPSFRVNPIVGIPIVWVSNPFTIVPIYFSNYWFGHLVLNLFSDRPVLSYAQVTERLGQFGGVSGVDGFGLAFRSLCRMLDYMEYDYHLTSYEDITNP